MHVCTGAAVRIPVETTPESVGGEIKMKKIGVCWTARKITVRQNIVSKG